MEKKLEDYLHLYLGAELFSVSSNRKVAPIFGVEGNNVKFKVSGVIYSAPISNYKLILRPLSDMTEEERMWWFNSVKKEKDIFYEAQWMTEVNGQPCEGHWTLWTTDMRYGRLGYTVGINSHFIAEQFRWLLSKHFDLFGLIDAGLTIDKTTLK